MSKYAPILDSLIAAHNIFVNKDEANYEGGLKIIYKALTSEHAGDFIAELALALNYVADKDLAATDDFKGAADEDLPKDKDGDGIVDEDSEAASPVNEGLVDSDDDGDGVPNELDNDDDSMSVGSTNFVTKNYSIDDDVYKASAAILAQRAKG